MLQGITPAGVLYYTQDTGIRQVFVADFGRDGRLPGGRLRQTASLPGESPSWSPDGSLLALKRPRDDGARDFVVGVRETGQQLSYTPPRMGDRKPSWFPDGRLQIITNSPLRVRVDQGQLKAEEVAHAIPLGTTSHDEKTMYVAEEGNATTPGVIVAYDTATGDRRSSFPVQDISRSMALSPDGTSLALVLYSAGGNRIARINVDGTGYRVLHSGNVANPSVAWSADGTAILFAQDQGSHVRLMRVPVNGGSAEAVGIETTRYPAIDTSPDGKHIAYGTIEGATEIWTLNLPASMK